MGWSGRVVASVSVGMPWAVRADPNGLVRARFGFVHFGSRRPFPACFSPALRAAAFRALFRCLLCLARTSLHPGVAFLCFGLLPSVLCFAVSYASPVPPCTQVVASCSPRPASLSPRPRSFLFFGPLFPALRPALSCPSACTLLHPPALYTLLHPPAPLPTLFCASARFLLLSSLCPRSSPCKIKPPKAWPSGVFGYCRSRITSQEPSG